MLRAVRLGKEASRYGSGVHSCTLEVISPHGLVIGFIDKYFAPSVPGARASACNVAARRPGAAHLPGLEKSGLTGNVCWDKKELEHSWLTPDKIKLMGSNHFVL